MRGFNSKMGSGPDYAEAGAQYRSHIDVLIDDALDHSEITSHNKKTKMSASMFPMCSILLFTELLHQENSGHYWRRASILLNVFAGSGIAMHETIQYALGFSGRQFGHYHCKDYRCKEGYLDPKGFRPKIDNPRLHTFTTDNICPHCGRGMAYVEIAIERDDIIMYLDSVLVSGEGDDATAEVLDLKSCTSRAAFAATNPKELAKHNNIAQIRSYAVEFEKTFKVRVTHYGLAYVPRDNPKGFKVHRVEFTDKEARIAQKNYKDERRKWKLANRAVAEVDPIISIEGRKCSSSSDHDRLHPFDPCPLSGVCFSQLQLHRVLRDFVVLSAKHKDKDYFTVMAMATAAKKSKQLFKSEKPKARHTSI